MACLWALMRCYAASPECRPPMQRHHIVKQQRIRKEWMSLGAAHRRGGPKPWAVGRALADERNLVPTCLFHHLEDSPVPLPTGFVNFVQEYGLEGQLPRWLAAAWDAIMEADNECAPATRERPGAGHGGTISMPRRTLEDRLWSKVDRTAGPNGCWLWQGHTDPKGYGRLWMPGNKHAFAHRVAYELSVGLIPPRYTIDHLCRNHGCVNPAHLEAVTAGENVLRGEGVTAVHARQTHCKHGHPLDGDNLYVTKDGHRKCVACRRSRLTDLRRRRGIDPRQAVLTPEQCDEICDLAGALTQREIGERFGVSQATISRVHRGIYLTEAA